MTPPPITEFTPLPAHGDRPVPAAVVGHVAGMTLAPVAVVPQFIDPPAFLAAGLAAVLLFGVSWGGLEGPTAQSAPIHQRRSFGVGPSGPHRPARAQNP